MNIANLIEGRASSEIVSCTVDRPMRDVVALLADRRIGALPVMEEGRVAGIDARIFRVSFTGELGYEVSVANCHSLALWQAFLRVGENYDLTPIGIEALHVLRAEKGYIAVGHDTDGTTTPGDLGMAYGGDSAAAEATIQTVLAAAKAAGLPCEITAGPNDVERLISEGFRVLIGGAGMVEVGRRAARRQ